MTSSLGKAVTLALYTMQNLPWFMHMVGPQNIIAEYLLLPFNGLWGSLTSPELCLLCFIHSLIWHTWHIVWLPSSSFLLVVMSQKYPKDKVSWPLPKGVVPSGLWAIVPVHRIIKYVHEWICLTQNQFSVEYWLIPHVFVTFAKHAACFISGKYPSFSGKKALKNNKSQDSFYPHYTKRTNSLIYSISSCLGLLGTLYRERSGLEMYGWGILVKIKSLDWWDH